MSQSVTFGSPDSFSVSIGWLDDGSSLSARPRGHGFSLGSLELVVRGYSLTTHYEGGDRPTQVRWYLLPIFRWIAHNWTSLFHEEDFPWPERTEASAATACNVALERFLPEDHSDRIAIYDQVRNWWERHALRAGAAGGLLPDLFMRRLGDGVELSWSSRAAAFAPEGFSFALAAGAAVLPVRDVAEPLWKALQWVIETAPASDDPAREELRDLTALMSAAGHATDRDVRDVYLGRRLADKVETAFHDLGRSDLLSSFINRDVPVAELLAAPVAMFGGVDPNLTMRDVRTLSTILVAQLRQGDTSQLDSFVDRSVGFPITPAHDEGYDLAEALLEDLGIDTGDFVDVAEILARLDVSVLRRRLETNTIRGVAIAGSGFVPTVIINTNSPFSRNEPGRRFTMAHELCHILYDQSRARRVTQASGPWAPSGIEKRANAFAAMLLMPRGLIERYRRRHQAWSSDRVLEVASALVVSVGALIEHLYNLGYINEAEREDLRLH